MQKKSSVKIKDNQNGRREFLRHGGILSAGAFIYGLTRGVPMAHGSYSGRRRPFVVYIHMGAMEGYSAGLIQPTDMDRYPSGVFFTNQIRKHPNPNVNVHYKSGNLIFNDYTKTLEAIADHMLFTVTTPQSLAHDEAFLIQQTGSRTEGTGRSPMWAAGFAQATGEASKPSYVITDGSSRGFPMLAATTPAVTSVTANSIDTLRANFSDPTTIPKTSSAPEAQKYAAFGKSAYSFDQNLSIMSSAEKQGAQASIDGLIKGISGLEDANGQKGIKSLINDAMTRSDLDTRLANVPDKTAVQQIDDNGNVSNNAALRGMIGFHERLKLAAALIETQASSGIHINLPVHDYHSGGAHVRTARTGSMVWTQIAQFWTWVKTKGYQDDVLIIVANEFNRTPANASSESFNGIISRGNPAGETIVSPGTDHHLSNGMVFINSKLPRASRLGYIGDTFVPTGGKLNGGPAPGTAPFTSLQLVVSVYMRVFPGVFPNYRAAREIWQPLKESDIIKELVG